MRNSERHQRLNEWRLRIAVHWVSPRPRRLDTLARHAFMERS